MKPLIFALLVCLPLRHLRVNSPFGYRWHPLTGLTQFHTGVDLQARRDTVFAVLNGMVNEVNFSDGLGLSIRLRHTAVETVYGHLSQAFVRANQVVAAGEAIGITGATGRVTGEHLHFAVQYRSHYIDPLQFLQMLLR